MVGGGGGGESFFTSSSDIQEHIVPVYAGVGTMGVQDLICYRMRSCISETDVTYIERGNVIG